MNAPDAARAPGLDLAGINARADVAEVERLAAEILRRGRLLHEQLEAIQARADEAQRRLTHEHR